MAKWNFHRPASRASSAPKKQTTTPNRRKTATGRWSFHDPKDTQPASGHGWHFDGAETTRTKRATVEGERWTCDYGCKSFVWTQAPEPGQFHAWDCPYWQNEGQQLTPF